MRRLKVSHITTYDYANPVSFGDHRMMLRPRDSHDLSIVSTHLSITPEPTAIRWLHDVHGNSSGGGREVARLVGINVGRVRAGCLIASSTLATVAGIIYVGVLGAADPVSGLNFLLPAFAAAYLGATSIVPGRFNPWGAFIAVYFLSSGITGLSMLGIPLWVTSLFNGGALILAVTLSQFARGREQMDL